VKQHTVCASLDLHWLIPSARGPTFVTLPVMADNAAVVATSADPSGEAHQAESVAQVSNMDVSSQSDKQDDKVEPANEVVAKVEVEEEDDDAMNLFDGLEQPMESISRRRSASQHLTGGPPAKQVRRADSMSWVAALNVPTLPLYDLGQMILLLCLNLGLMSNHADSDLLYLSLPTTRFDKYTFVLHSSDATGFCVACPDGSRIDLSILPKEYVHKLSILASCDCLACFTQFDNSFRKHPRLSRAHVCCRVAPGCTVLVASSRIYSPHCESPTAVGWSDSIVELVGVVMKDQTHHVNQCLNSNGWVEGRTNPASSKPAITIAYLISDFVIALPADKPALTIAYLWLCDWLLA
jgi:hypothetical protein